VAVAFLWLQIRPGTAQPGHKKGLRTEVLKPLMSVLSGEAESENVQRPSGR
jgi:hypothetical protein